jgi:hypothetical protein
LHAALYPTLTFNFVRDIAPVAFIGRRLAMSVNPSFPVKTVPEFKHTSMPARGTATGPNGDGDLTIAWKSA